MSGEKDEKMTRKERVKQAAGLAYWNGLAEGLSKRGYDAVVEDEDLMDQCLKTAKKLRSMDKESAAAVNPIVKKAARSAMQSIQ